MKIAIIPARGGSKRIPKKNIKEFCGKPMIAWSIEAAKESNLFDHIIVSTDDDEIAEVAVHWGAEVPFKRPDELSNDFVGSADVVKHALEWFISHRQTPDFICEIYATVPFICASDISDGFDQLKSNNVDMAFSVTSFAYPIQRSFRIAENNRVSMLYPENVATRSQDLEETYHDAGQFYWRTLDAALRQLPMISEYSAPVILPRYRVQDIDTPEDWYRAELMFKSLLKVP